MNKVLNLVGISAILSTLLVGIAFANSGAQPKMVGSQWAVYGETTLPNGGLNFHPIAHAATTADGVSFSMPDATASSPTFVNYLLDTYTTSLTEQNTITATISVQATKPGTTFMGDPLWYNLYGSPVNPAFVRLIVESNLPNDHTSTCTGNGNAENYWWADVSRYTFNPGSGTYTMTVPLNPADWSNICGQSGIADPTGFENALANVKYVGLSFGSGSFFASGVGVDGSTGSATFVLQNFQIS